jgi:hypothetical protein
MQEGHAAKPFTPTAIKSQNLYEKKILKSLKTKNLAVMTKTIKT